MFQQITVIGNLGGDPELRYTQSGLPVIDISLAVNRNWTASDGTPQSKATWFKVVFWNKNAENVAQYLQKGSRVLVVGEVEGAEAWIDRDGNPKATVKVNGNQVKFLSSNRDDDGAPPGRGDSGGRGVPATPKLDDEEIPF